MPDDKQHEPKSFRFPPGYFACSRAIERLKKFQDLIRHHKRWAHQIEFARPLDQLIPKGTKPEHQHTVIEREINRLLPLVGQDLHMVGVPTGVSWKKLEDAWDYDKPNQGIGVYDSMQSSARRRKFMPLSWLAYAVSIPVRVLIRAGLVSPFREGDTKVLDWTLGIIQAGWVVAIGWLSKAAAEGHWAQRTWHHIFG
ncbi:MAG: hypothetical protein AB7O67_23540 [Vicinamibacterales bacterium]